MLLNPPAQVQEVPPPPTAALDSMSLDLPGALDRARTDNPMLRAAKARVEERQGLITATRADALPQVTLVGDFTRSRDVTSIITGQASTVHPRTYYTTQAVLNQPLFYWGKIGTAIEIARMGEREAAHAYTTAELETLHGVAKAYIAGLSAQAELEVLSARQRTAEQFLEDVKSKLEAQSATELDRLRAESEFLAVIPESLQAEAAHKRAIEVLNGALGLDPRTPLRLSDLGLPQSSQKLSAQERSELAQFRQQEEMYRANDQILKADLRPRFDLGATYGYQTGRSGDLFQVPYDTWKVSVTMRFPLFDGFRSSGRRAQNAAQLEQVRQARIDKERSIAVEKSTSERELQKALAFHEAAEKAHDAGREALRMSHESFEQGLITSLDLLQADRTERQLESQRRRAELGVWSAFFDYRRSLGLPPL